MSTSLLAHAILSIGNMLSSSMYHYVWAAATAKTTKHPSCTHNQIRTAKAMLDKIESLPGLHSSPLWHSSTSKFDQFAGYLEVAPTRQIFYWYVESQHDPTTDPLVLWTNGGPGCSGLIGFFTEHGPFRVDQDLNLHENPFSWNKIANMLYIEQPAGVGFSVWDEKVDLVSNDAQSATDNLALIRQFLERFPERQSNPFYLASESYGGHYIPQLALKILTESNENGKNGGINFQGFFVGNPYVDPFSNFISGIEALYSHGLLPRTLMNTWRQNCTDSPKALESHHCEEVIRSIYSVVSRGINIYGLDYPVCLAKNVSSTADTTADYAQMRGKDNRALQAKREGTKKSKNAKVVTAQAKALLSQSSSIHSPTFLPTDDIYEPCQDLYTRQYLNQATVQKAIHAVNPKTHKTDWKMCTGDIHYSSIDVQTSVTDLYKELVSLGQQGLHSLQMFIYSGDDDSVCSTDGTQAWLFDLGVPPAEDQLWKPWRVEGEISGFWTTFDFQNQTKASLSFATIHGAGHEVPAYRPMESLELFRLFLAGGLTG